MLTLLWWIPLAMAPPAAVGLWRGARRLEAEAVQLEAAIVDLRRVRPLVVEVRRELAAVAAVEAARSVSRNVHDEPHR